MIAFSQVMAEGDSAAFDMPVGVDVPEMAQKSACGRSCERESSPLRLNRSTVDQMEIIHGRNISYWLTKRLPSTKLCVARCNGLKSEGMS